MRSMAGHTALGLDRLVFKYKRSRLLDMALKADDILRGSRP